MLNGLVRLLGMTQQIKNILLAILFASIGNNVLFVILPINLEVNGVSTALIGWVMAGYSLGIFLGSQYGHIMLSQVGHIRSYAAVGAVMSTTVGLHVFVESEWAMLFMRIVVGMTMAIIYLTLESWLNATSESHSRGTIYSLYQFSYSVGLLVAPFVATIFEPGDFRAFSLVTLFISLSLVPLVMTHFKTPQLTGNQAKLPIIEMLRDTPSAAVMSVLAGLCISALISLLALFGSWLELDKLQLAILISCAVGSSIFFQVPIGWLSDKFDARSLLLILCVVSLVSSLIILWAIYDNLPWWTIAVAVAVLGGCFFCIYPLCVKFVFDQMDTEKTLSAMSTLLIIFSFGSVLGPIIGSLFMELIAPWGLFLFFVVIMIGAIFFMIHRVLRSSSLEYDEERVPYVITIKMLRPMSVNLDPRTDYLMTKMDNTTVKTLANTIAISPSKTQSLIESYLIYLEGFTPEELLEALILLKPRLSKPIIRAMLLINPGKELDFTNALRDLISLNKSNINRLLLTGLTHKAEESLKQEIEELFTQFTTPAPITEDSTVSI
jgi:MFS family permease